MNSFELLLLLSEFDQILIFYTSSISRLTRVRLKLALQLLISCGMSSLYHTLEGKLLRANMLPSVSVNVLPVIFFLYTKHQRRSVSLDAEITLGGVCFVADRRVLHVPGAGGGRGGNTGRGRGEGGDERGIGDDGEVADIDQSIDRYDYLIAFPHSREGRARGGGWGRGRGRWGEVRRLISQSVQPMQQSHFKMFTHAVFSCMQFKLFLRPKYPHLKSTVDNPVNTVCLWVHFILGTNRDLPTAQQLEGHFKRVDIVFVGCKMDASKRNR